MIPRSSSLTNPGDLERQLESALDGVRHALAPGLSLQIDRATHTQPQLVALLTGYLSPFQAAAAAKIAYAQALAARRAVEPKARELLFLLKSALIALLGRGDPELEHFGLSSNLPRKPSAQTALLAVAKAKLTRKKRGTLGRRQRTALVVVGTPSVTLGPEGVTVHQSVGEQAQAAADTPAPAS